MYAACTTGKSNDFLIEAINKRNKEARQKKAKALNKKRKKDRSPGSPGLVDESGDGLDLSTAEQLEALNLAMNDFSLKVFSAEGEGSVRAQKHYLRHNLPKFMEMGPEAYI